MKVGIWIGDQNEVLYDSITDEIIFREIIVEKPLVIRVPFMDVMRARLKSRPDLDARPTRRRKKSSP